MASLAHADGSLSNSMTFFGRWDLRAPDRATTVNTGSYVLAAFTGDSLQAKFDLSLNNAERPTIAWRIDGGDWHEDEIAPAVSLATGLTPGNHTAMLMVRGLDEKLSRWKPPLISSVTFLGFDLGSGGNFLPAMAEWVHPKLKIEFLGDSITEGVLVQLYLPDKKNKCWVTDALGSYSCLTALDLGAQWRQVGFGGTGLAKGGGGGAPGALKTFNFFYQDCPRDDWQPDLVVINQGSNERKLPPATYEPLYAQYLALVRQGYPQAKIVALQPFNGAQKEPIQQAVAAAQQAGDKQIYYIDTTGWYKGPLHPDIKASPAIADKLTAALKSDVLGW